jgi:hypothetical protein
MSDVYKKHPRNNTPGELLDYDSKIWILNPKEVQKLVALWHRCVH